MDVDEIAALLVTTHEAVIQALAPMRMRKLNPSRATLNATLAARDFAVANRFGDEPMWKIVDRLFFELAALRAENFVLRAMKG